YFAQNLATIDEHGNYLDEYRAFYRWLEHQPGAAAVTRDGDLTFSADAAPKILDWLRKFKRDRPSAALLKVMVDQATPASTKVRAAESVLSHAAKAIEIEDIEARLEELERAADESKPGWRKA